MLNAQCPMPNPHLPTNMLIIKRKYISLVFFALLGLVYFTTISNLDINPFFRSQIALMPTQLAVIIYWTYLRWSRKESPESRNRGVGV